MPRFYFHLRDDIDVPDDVGVELPSLEAAIARAFAEARQVAGHMAMESGRIALGHRIDIEDEHGTVLDTVKFGDVIRVED